MIDLNKAAPFNERDQKIMNRFIQKWAKEIDEKLIDELASDVKLLPAPRFPIMSQQEIILTKVRLEAEERYYRTKAAFESNPESVVAWYYHLVEHVKWKRYCIGSNHPDYVDDQIY